jgi:hypothetical protein
VFLKINFQKISIKKQPVSRLLFVSLPYFITFLAEPPVSPAFCPVYCPERLIGKFSLLPFPYRRKAAAQGK